MDQLWSTQLISESVKNTFLCQFYNLLPDLFLILTLKTLQNLQSSFRIIYCTYIQCGASYQLSLSTGILMW